MPDVDIEKTGKAVDDVTPVFHLEADALCASNDPRPLDLVDAEFGDGMQQVPSVEVMEVLGHAVFSEARF